MFDNFLILPLTIAVLSCYSSLTWGQSNTAPETTFACEDKNGIPITVARNQGGKTAVVFYWQGEILVSKTLSTPQELCNNVSEKSDNYAKDYNISDLGFLGTEISGLPIICIISNLSGCGKVLFALQQSQQAAIVTQNILQTILNPKIISSQKIPHGREHLYGGYFFIDLELLT